MTAYPDRNLPWPICWDGVVLTARAEGCRLRAYKNFPKEPWTCGWGETDGVGPNTVWTQDYADRRFCDSLTERRDAVLAACTVEPNEHQLAAMVSLSYNIGMGWEGKVKPKGAKDGFRQSTVLRQHNLGNVEHAGRAFGLWNQADGKVSNGLVARRAAEAALYLRTVPGGAAAPMPQAVDPESKPMQGPIAMSGTATAGVGVVGVLNFFGEQFAAVKGSLATAKSMAVDILGIPPDLVLPLLLLLIGAAVVVYRKKQRDQGHA